MQEQDLGPEAFLADAANIHALVSLRRYQITDPMLIRQAATVTAHSLFNTWERLGPTNKEGDASGIWSALYHAWTGPNRRTFTPIMEVLQVSVEMKNTMNVREVDMKTELILAGLMGAWYVEKERPSTEALLFAVQNQMGPLTVGILARYGYKFPDSSKGSNVMMALMAYTQQYGANILMEVCKKRYSGANGRIATGAKGGTALHLVCANAATLLVSTTPTVITPTDPEYPSTVWLEINTARLPYAEDDTHMEVAVNSLLRFGVSPHILNDEFKSPIDILKALDIHKDARIVNLIKKLEKVEKRALQGDAWRFQTTFEAGIEKGMGKDVAELIAKQLYVAC